MSYTQEERDFTAAVNRLNDRLPSQFEPPVRAYGDSTGFGSAMLVAIVFIVVAIMASVILNVTW